MLQYQPGEHNTYIEEQDFKKDTKNALLYVNEDTMRK